MEDTINQDAKKYGKSKFIKGTVIPLTSPSVGTGAGSPASMDKRRVHELRNRINKGKIQLLSKTSSSTMLSELDLSTDGLRPLSLLANNQSVRSRVFSFFLILGFFYGF